LLVSLSGLILDFELTSANCHDLVATEKLLSDHLDLEVLGDKNYVNQTLSEQLSGPVI